MDIYQVLERFRQEALTNRDLGNKFERLIAKYLLTDPLYSSQFDEVWLWSDWPLHRGADTGIDIVARERVTGNYCAIQCKFFLPDHQLQKRDIDSFFTASGKTFSTPEGQGRFSSRIIVSTTDKWSTHAESALEDQTIPVTRLRVQDLAISPIDWSRFSLDRPADIELRARKTPRPHQVQAIKDVFQGFETSDRGKLIMACGTGKTFTALRIAEDLAGPDGSILFLVPSISLLSQTLREWTAESRQPFHAFAVCSDTRMGKHNEDLATHDLAIPATTDADRLASAVEMFRQSRKQRTVIFSTYQSIAVISKAQELGLPDFDITICDEAHRTTGVTLVDEDESHFVRVHRQDFLKSRKRLYMTATPRIYSDAARSRAEENEAELCSMDDEKLYGPVFHRLGFGEAVGQGLLSDYKVFVLAVDERHVSRALQVSLANPESELKLDDAVKIVGCWNGLAKRMVGGELLEEDPAPMRRAVAFSRTIKDSKHITNLFQTVADEYIQRSGDGGDNLACEVQHVDGTFNVLQRNERLDWLKGSAGENTCRILSNARCLSEGVDVPALDAVLFLNPRNSVVDVVQSVGRVMRRSEGKKYGYVILPISVPAGIPPEEALNDNERYRIVWQVLQALRAHDDRFNATVNKLELNKTRPNNIQIIGIGGAESAEGNAGEPTQIHIDFPEIEAWKDAIYAKIVIKCGDRRYWEDWARDVAQIADRHISRITALLEAGGEARQAFDRFLSGLHENINPSIDEDEAIEMLSQHLITRPVFDAIFENYSFARNNPVSRVMQEVLDVLEANALEREIETLQGFYESVRQRVSGIDNAAGRQRVVTELYDKFFKLAFPRMAQRLGIVYTPVEIVDFIINSAEFALRTHFNASLSDKNVHILDPFTGTGTFIVRLLQSGHIRPQDLERKYREELHANEIVLLAYYIAAINIEETYHGLTEGEYQPFDGIVLTDTFQLGEEETRGATRRFGEAVFPENNSRVRRQKQRDIRVIIANPPYKAQQGSENDNNRNITYLALDERIRTTYAAHSNAKLKKNLYDSYVRAIRWASDRIKDQGIIGFVTNGSFIDASNMDGIRKVLPREFSTIYCFNLRGNQRTSGETSRKEGGKIFGSGSRAPIAISIFIKNPNHSGPCQLLYHDIGDYLSREEKLKIIADYASIDTPSWQTITPNLEGDWINQRNPEFETLIYLGNNKAKNNSLFGIYSNGIITNRDSWVYNYSAIDIESNISRMIIAYNEDLQRYREAISGRSKSNWPPVEDVINTDPRRISWSRALKSDVAKGKALLHDASSTVKGMYRPYMLQWLYFDRHLNEMVYQIPRLFPTPRHPNLVISATGTGANKPFSTIISAFVPDLELISKGQNFPLYWYEKTAPKPNQKQPTMFNEENASDADDYTRHDAITNWALNTFKDNYADQKIIKEDIFYYVYGILHSPQYRERYKSSLSKMLPRVPFAQDFWAFSKAGRELAHWHLNYETVEPWPLDEVISTSSHNPRELFRVDAMKFAGIGRDRDKSTIIYNSRVRLSGIPLEAYEYIVNGKSALDWIMERYAVTVDKANGIRNDPNDWSEDPRYIVDLIKRIVRVSIETVRIVKTLPPL